MSRPKSVTIADLAAHLGVHKSTVSRAMDPGRRHLISSEMLRLVEEAARELGYRQNRAAATLSSGKSRAIGVLLPDITNPVFPPILRGIEDALDAHGYFAILANTARGPDAARIAVERLLAQRVDGFLIASATRDDAWLEDLRKTGATIVLVNRTDGRGKFPAVISDDKHGMSLAVDHLVGLGHRRIAHLGGPANLSTGLSRREGFEQALRGYGLEPAGIVPCGAFSVDEGRAGMQRLLDERAGDGVPSRARAGAPPAFTAVVAANDLLALGALRALEERHIEVPARVSVVGHNDMPFLEQVAPPLTTIRIQHYEMGYRAARLLLDALQDAPGTGGATVMLRPQLVVRASTSPPAPARRRASQRAGAIAVP